MFCLFADILTLQADDKFLIVLIVLIQVFMIGKFTAVVAIEEICKDGTKNKRKDIELEDLECVLSAGI